MFLEVDDEIYYIKMRWSSVSEIPAENHLHICDQDKGIQELESLLQANTL